MKRDRKNACFHSPCFSFCRLLGSPNFVGALPLSLFTTMPLLTNLYAFLQSHSHIASPSFDFYFFISFTYILLHFFYLKIRGLSASSFSGSIPTTIGNFVSLTRLCVKGKSHPHDVLTTVFLQIQRP
jgi:hypothetical protein